jgi:ankyrin repeat protein
MKEIFYTWWIRLTLTGGKPDVVEEWGLFQLTTVHEVKLISNSIYAAMEKAFSIHKERFIYDLASSMYIFHLLTLSGIDYYELTVEMKMDTIENPLHDAARRGNIEFLQDCLSNGVSPTGLDSTGNSPIHWSARGGHADCLQVLVEAAIKQFTSAKQFINAQVTTS